MDITTIMNLLKFIIIINGNLLLLCEVKTMKFDSNNLIIDKINTIKFYSKCPRCHEKHELVEYENGGLASPHFCPNCGFDIHKYNNL